MPARSEIKRGINKEIDTQIELLKAIKTEQVKYELAFSTCPFYATQILFREANSSDMHPSPRTLENLLTRNILIDVLLLLSKGLSVLPETLIRLPRYGLWYDILEAVFFVDYDGKPSGQYAYPENVEFTTDEGNQISRVREKWFPKS